MIDENCHILKQPGKKGFCWCPSAAWGKTDEQVCESCMLKNMMCRFCGADAKKNEQCKPFCGSDNVVPMVVPPQKKARKVAGW